MPTIQAQIKELRKKIKVPWRIVYVDREIKPEEFEEKTIYVHIWIGQAEGASNGTVELLDGQGA
jgi:hypothetical protein